MSEIQISAATSTSYTLVYVGSSSHLKCAVKLGDNLGTLCYCNYNKSTNKASEESKGTSEIYAKL